MTEPDSPGAAPPHHRPGGGFDNPWPTAGSRGRGGVLRWWWERATQALPPDPPPDQLPRAEAVLSGPVPAGEMRATWVGHSTFVLQVGGLNLLTDPHFSARASPLRWAGPRRFTPPGVSLEALPPIDAVLISHDHYDHLDDLSVRRLHGRFGDRLRWFTPLGYAQWFRSRGVRTVTELDWGAAATLAGPGGEATVTCLPAQHWTSRRPWDRCSRLWSSWSLRASDGAGVYFAGDSGWFPGYPEIGSRHGPFDLVLLPIGAYEPRWFMRPSHMNPEEAVRAYRELGGRGVLAAMHWGTFRLTDEDPLEPPRRTRAAWAGAGLPQEHLWVAAHGETRSVAVTGRRQ